MKALALLLALAAEPREGIDYALIVKVADAAAAANRARAAAEASGGHLQRMTAKHLELRVPPAQLAAVVAEVAALGTVLTRETSRAALEQNLRELESKLAARADVLARVREVLAAAGPADTVAVERRMLQLVEENEGLAGTRRVLADRAAFARLVIDFQVPAPRVVDTTPAPFPWLETLGVESMLARSYHYEDDE